MKTAYQKFNHWAKHRIQRRDRVLTILAELKRTGYHYPPSVEKDMEYFLKLVNS